MRPLFDPEIAIGGIRVSSELREQIIDENWFPDRPPRGSTVRKGPRVTWYSDGREDLMKVTPDQVAATPGNIFYPEKLGTFARMMRQGEITVSAMPAGYLDVVTKTDIAETQAARENDLIYDGQTRPFTAKELGKKFVRLNSGNHRAFAAFMAGEPFVWVRLLRRSNPAWKRLMR
jgi:hypothetical protein